MPHVVFFDPGAILGAVIVWQVLCSGVHWVRGGTTVILEPTPEPKFIGAPVRCTLDVFGVE